MEIKHVIFGKSGMITTAHIKVLLENVSCEFELDEIPAMRLQRVLIGCISQDKVIDDLLIEAMGKLIKKE